MVITDADKDRTVVILDVEDYKKEAENNSITQKTIRDLIAIQLQPTMKQSTR